MAFQLTLQIYGAKFEPYLPKPPKLFKTRKLWYRKDDRAMRPTHACPENFRDSDYTHGYYSQHFSWTFAPIDPMNVPTKFELRSFTHS